MANRGAVDADDLLDRARDTVAVLDEGGTVRYVNAAVERILGYRPDDLVGTDAFEYVHPEDRERVETTFRSVVGADRDAVEDVEFRFRGADDSWVWLESRLSSRPAAEVGCCVVSSRDVTERKRAKRDRRTVSNYLRELTRNADDALWMFTADWSEVLFVNDAYEDLYGRSAEALREDATDFVEAAHPEDRDRIRDAMARLSAGHPIEMEHRVNPSENYRRWVWVKGEPIERDGEVVRTVGFTRDVTERHRRERQLRIMDRVLRHNLRNEMNVILGHARDLREECGPDADEHVDPIEETGSKLMEAAEKERAIVDLLLDRDPDARVDVVEAVTSAVDWAHTAYPEADVETDVPDSAEATCVSEVERAVRELIENAVEHATVPGPEVSVEVRTDPDGVYVIVRDQGPPIPDQEVDVLLGRVDEDALFHGSGLGLWLVNLVVDVSGGDLRFDVEEAEGAGERNVVTLSFPRAR